MSDLPSMNDRLGKGDTKINQSEAPPLNEAESALLGEEAGDDDEKMETCVVDDDGNLIDPAAEGSYLMAEGMLDMIREQTGDYTAEVELEPYEPDFDVPQRYAQSLAFFADEKRYLDAHGEEVDAEDEAAPATTANNVKANDASASALPTSTTKPALQKEGNEEGDYYDDEEEEGDGMFPAMSSRAFTADEEWVLEKIIKRRVNKDPKGEGGPFIYYCKWRGYEEPTWETREVMEEAGFIPELNAFDTKGDAHHKVKPVRVKRFSKQQYQSRLESFFGASDMDIIHNELLKKHSQRNTLKVFHYAKMNPSLAEPFYNRWKALKDTHVPTLVFHGTRPVNLPSIYRMGLVVGGTNGVRVANGTAYGSGVYTARTPATPKDYAYEASCVIVCVGLVPAALVKNPGSAVEAHSVYSCGSDYLIFRNAVDVYPMWLVQFEGVEEQKPKEPTQLEIFDFLARAQSGFGRFLNRCNSAAYQRFAAQDTTTLTDQERKQVVRAVAEMKCSSGKGFSKAALKAQPRRIKEMLALAAQERNARK